MVATYDDGVPPLEDALTSATLSALEQTVRALRVPEGEVDGALDRIVAHATTTVGAAEWAGVILLQDGWLVAQATRGEPPHVLDELQRELGLGPCIDVARTQSSAVLHDTTSDQRWPAVAERAAQLGVRAMLCVPLWVDQRHLGALSLYGPEPEAFTEHDRRVAELYAALAAIALADAQRVADLETAIASRDVIGQAKGILIERHRLTPDLAFAALSRASQHTNRKLVEVARHLVLTGELLGA